MILSKERLFDCVRQLLWSLLLIYPMLRFRSLAARRGNGNAEDVLAVWASDPWVDRWRTRLVNEAGTRNAAGVYGAGAEHLAT
jgi:hypothetical protein